MQQDSSLKILVWDQIEDRVKDLRLKKQTIVLTTGVWDLMHDGHVTYLENAANWGHALFVGVDTNARVQRSQKGSKRPILDQAIRLRTIAGLASVDHAFLFDDLESLVKIVYPNILVISPTYTEDPEHKRFGIANPMDIRIIQIPSMSQTHTSGIIQDIVAKYGHGA
ncbi:MAG: adenylyltransferase/cytidyltransferase family protein [Patescibacteria group bacterium]